MRCRRIARTNPGRLMALIFLLGMTVTFRVSANDWPQWCGSDGKNMVSGEKGLPESFSPGRKRTDGTIDLATATNVKWGVKLGNAFYSTPSVAGGNVYVGGLDDTNGIFVCFDAATGRRLWQWKAPPREVPHNIDGFSIGISSIPQEIGVCSSAAVEGDRVYFVSNRFDVICLDAAGSRAKAGDGPSRVEVRHVGETGRVSLRCCQRVAPHRRRSALPDHLQRRGSQHLPRSRQGEEPPDTRPPCFP